MINQVPDPVFRCGDRVTIGSVIRRHDGESAVVLGNNYYAGAGIYFYAVVTDSGIRVGQIHESQLVRCLVGPDW